MMSLCCAWILMDNASAIGCSAFLAIVVLLLGTEGRRIWGTFHVRSGGLDDLDTLTRGSIQQGGAGAGAGALARERGGSRGSSFIQRKGSEVDR